MAIYAHVVSNKIAEIFSPPPGLTIQQCFHPDLTWVDITGRDPQPQAGWDAAQQSDVWVITAPIAPVLSLIDQARRLLAGNVQARSISDSSLNGTYSVDAETRADLMAEMVSLAANNTFTDGSIILGWPDVAGVSHDFDAAHFKSFATAIGIYVTALKRVSSRLSDTLPAQPIQIM